MMAHGTRASRAPRIGSLFSGYGGLELGVITSLGGAVAWHSENDAAASKVLTHRFPGVPNLGDITKIDWTQVEPVDVLTGGSPCQDVSHAGKRVGMKAGTRSGLWASMCDAVDVLRPGLVVWENVRGVLSAEADSALEPCAGCVGDGDDGAVLRALGRVLGDLAGIGYDCRWYGLRAADIGAPHGRFRVFVVAHPAGDTRWLEHRDGAPAADTDVIGHERGGEPQGRWTGPADGDLLPTPTSRGGKGPNQRGDTSCLTGALMPAPRATDGTKGGPGQRGSSGDLMLPSAVALLPTPAVNHMGEGKTVEAWDEWTAAMQVRHSNGNGHGKSLAIEAQRLLPTPKASNNENRQSEGYGGRNGNFYGIYAAAIARWEHLTRTAPAPTQLSKKGTPQLSPRFSEWMMGLADGWVTDVPGLSRNDMLRILGNGVVSQQAAAAVRALLLPASKVAA